MRKVILTIILILSWVGPDPIASPEDLARYDLSLCGYELDMEYAEAAALRPFSRMEPHQDHPELPEIVSCYTDRAYLDDIEFRVRVDFIEDKIYKITGRFPPHQFNHVRDLVIQRLGEGSDKSHTYSDKSGAHRHQYVYLWEFPSAKFVLIGSELNPDFYTLSLFSTGPQMKKMNQKVRDLLQAGELPREQRN